MSYGVARRTNEIGLRMALGAKGSNVIGMILREVMLLTVAGSVTGVAVAIACTLFVESQPFGLTPNDPLTFAVAGMILLVVGTVAGYIPARRASKIDPMIALRYE